MPKRSGCILNFYVFTKEDHPRPRGEVFLRLMGDRAEVEFVPFWQIQGFDDAENIIRGIARAVEATNIHFLKIPEGVLSEVIQKDKKLSASMILRA